MQSVERASGSIAQPFGLEPAAGPVESLGQQSVRCRQPSIVRNEESFLPRDDLARIEIQAAMLAIRKSGARREKLQHSRKRLEMVHPEMSKPPKPRRVEVLHRRSVAAGRPRCWAVFWRLSYRA